MGRAPWTSQGAKNNGWDGGYDPNQLKVFKGTVSVISSYLPCRFTTVPYNPLTDQGYIHIPINLLKHCNLMNTLFASCYIFKKYQL